MFLHPVYGAISDKTGLKNDFTIQTSGYDFEVKAVSNFEINDIQFSRDDKKLTFDISSTIENNFAEIEIPINLIDGNLTVYVNGSEIFPEIKKNDKISFIVLEFDGKGPYTLEIIGTTYLPEFSNIVLLVMGMAITATLLSGKFLKF